MLLVLEVSSFLLEDCYRLPIAPLELDPLVRIEDMIRDRKEDTERLAEQVNAMTRRVEAATQHANTAMQRMEAMTQDAAATNQRIAELDQRQSQPAYSIWRSTNAANGIKTWTKCVSESKQLGIIWNGSYRFTCTKVRVLLCCITSKRI